jgi:hypothetical protein
MQKSKSQVSQFLKKEVLALIEPSCATKGEHLSGSTPARITKSLNKKGSVVMTERWDKRNQMPLG